MNNSEFRQQSSLSYELNRFFEDITSLRSRYLESYDELTSNARYLQELSKKSEKDNDGKKRFKYVSGLIDSFQSQLWEINEALLSLQGFEVIEHTHLPGKGEKISRQLIDILDDMKPRLHNLMKVWKLNPDDDLEFLKVETNLCELCDNEKFNIMKDILLEIINDLELHRPQLKALKQKKII